MVLRVLVLVAFMIGMNSPLLAQRSQPRITLGVESHLLVGGEMNASFDFLVGGRGTYLFSEKEDFQYFVSIAAATDVFNMDSRLITADAQLGTYWKRQRKLSLFASAGLNYLQETHRFLLSDGPRTWQDSSWGLTGQLGLNLRLSPAIHSQIFVKQINLSYTSIGVGLSYQF